MFLAEEFPKVGVEEDAVRVEFTPDALKIEVFEVKCLDAFASQVGNPSPVRSGVELLEFVVEFAQERLVGGS